MSSKPSKRVHVDALTPNLDTVKKFKPSCSHEPSCSMEHIVLGNSPRLISQSSLSIVSNSNGPPHLLPVDNTDSQLDSTVAIAVEDEDEVPTEIFDDSFDMSTDDEVQENQLRRLLETNEQCGIIDLLSEDDDEETHNSVEDLPQSTSTGSSEAARYLPEIELSIDQLDLFASSLCVKGKVVDKTPMKGRDQLNQSKYFIFTMVDHTGLIKVGVHDDVCEELHNMIQVNKVFSFEKISLTKDLYRPDLYHLSVNANSVIKEIFDQSLSERRHYIHQQLVREVQKSPSGKLVDFEGKIKIIGDIQSFMTQQRTVHYCDVYMEDYEHNQIKVVFLDNYALQTTFWKVNQFFTIQREVVTQSRDNHIIVVDETSVVTKEPENAPPYSPGY